MFTLGFTIAFTGRQTIFDLSLNFMKKIINAEGAGLLSMLASIFITIISVLLIYSASYFLKDTPREF